MKSKLIVVTGGARSGKAAAYLKRAGADAVDMGGIAGYKGEIVGGR